MLSYWFPTPLSFWWPLSLTIVFAVLAVIAVGVTLARREEEPDASAIAVFYGIGLGLAALTEFMMFLDAAFGWSLATAFTISASVVTFAAVVVAAVAILAIIIAIGMQFQEENTYRSTHRLAH